MKTETREETTSYAWPGAAARGQAETTDDTYYGLLEVDAGPVLPLGVVRELHDTALFDELRELVVTYVGGLGTESDSVAGRVFELRQTRSTSQLIQDMKETSGLTWDELGRMFGVSTRAVHHWAQGGRPNAHNSRRIHRLHSLIHASDTGNSAATRHVLMQRQGEKPSLYVQLVDEVTSDRPVDGFSPLQLINAEAEESPRQG